MAYFEDLTPYSYCKSFGHNHLNVGWLSKEYPYHRGLVSSMFAYGLKQLCKVPVNLCRGHHVCEFCIPPDDVIPRDHAYLWEMGRAGNGEIHVPGMGGVIYVAPVMVFHYVVEHQYQPPEQFITAVENWLEAEARHGR